MTYQQVLDTLTHIEVGTSATTVGGGTNVYPKEIYMSIAVTNGQGYGYHYSSETDTAPMLKALATVPGMPPYEGTDIVEYVRDIVPQYPGASLILDVALEGNYTTGELELTVFAPDTRVSYDDYPDAYDLQEAEEASVGFPRGLKMFHDNMAELGFDVGGPSLSDYKTIR